MFCTLEDLCILNVKWERFWILYSKRVGVWCLFRGFMCIV